MYELYGDKKMSNQETKTMEPAPVSAEKERVMSVDVLRGFDMFWLIGGSGCAFSLLEVIGGPLKEPLGAQLEHVTWIGFRFYDLIFPLFVFMVGMSVVFSLSKTVKGENRQIPYARIFRRFLIMFALGVIYSGGFSQVISEVRWMGVLQRLALSYLFAALLFCFLDWKGILATCIATLLGYWLVVAFMPVPGHTGISWEPGKNIACYIDSILLPGRKAEVTFDPEGILSTLPAVCTALMGILAALFLKSGKYSPTQKCLAFVGAGIACVLVGQLWGLHFPVIKKIWSSSFVLVAGGYSLLLLGFFYWVVDIAKIRWWITPFVWIGVNPLTIYLLRNILDFNKLATRFTGGSIEEILGPAWAELLHDSVALGLALTLLWYLNKKKIYLRL
jgi:predicted acyltransferase